MLCTKKINRRIIDEAVPILSEMVAEGSAQGILKCGNISERVRMIQIISSDMFNHADFTSADIDAFIDAAEKIPKAKKIHSDLFISLSRSPIKI